MPEIQNEQTMQPTLKGELGRVKILNMAAFIVFVLGLAIMIINLMYSGKYCNGVDLGQASSGVMNILFVVAIVLFIIIGIICKKNKIKSRANYYAVLLILFLVIEFISLISLSHAGDRAKDASIKSDLSQLNTAEILYADDNNGSFTDDCTKLVPKYISKCLTHPETGQPYNIIVSNDSKMWYVETSLMHTVNEICLSSTAPKLYLKCGNINSSIGYQCEEISK